MSHIFGAGGYPIDLFVDVPLLKDLTCGICLNILRNPVGTNCNNGIHTFCQDCLNSWIKTPQTCPICASYLNSNIDSYKIIYTTKNIVESFQCKCKYGTCTWADTCGKLLTHLSNECQFFEMPCKNMDNGCQTKLLLSKREEHHKECVYQKIKCSLCNESLLKKDEQDHNTNKCQEGYTNCTECKCKVIRRLFIPHIYTDCSESIVLCAYSKYGCNVKHKKKNKMNIQKIISTNICNLLKNMWNSKTIKKF